MDDNNVNLSEVNKSLDKEVDNSVDVNDNNDKDIEETYNEDEFFYTLKIPNNRIGALIGKKGAQKKRLQELTGAKIEIDSKEGMVSIYHNDSLKLYVTKEIIKAVGRGFNPEVALLLLKQDYTNEIISLRDYVKSKNSLIRIKGRIIGEKGKSRETIEKLTETNICVFGKTVSIIGRLEKINLTKESIIMLIEGSPHAGVYEFLERSKRKVKEDNILETFVKDRNDY